MVDLAYERAIDSLDAFENKANLRVSAISTALALRPISMDELNNSRLAPREILKDYLYADLRFRAAAGSTGKTTVALSEAVTLALCRELWGRMPLHPCRTVFVTREDSREILAARMREIMRAMELTPAEVATVLENVMIIDVSGISFRVSLIAGDMVEPHTENLNLLAEILEPFAPDWIIFDPLISFGIGEGRVNDAEQGIVESFRVLRNRLDCCIEGIHHVGKQNARDKVSDQYAARGGSALPDGSRMMAIMNPLSPAEWLSETGKTLGLGESGIVMALPKLSFAPQQEPIYIRRKGFLFEHEIVVKQSKEQVAQTIENQVYQFISYEHSQGRKYCASDLESAKDKLSLTRNQIRSAISALKVSGRILFIGKNGQSGSHFEPVTVAEDGGEGCSK